MDAVQVCLLGGEEEWLVGVVAVVEERMSG